MTKGYGNGYTPLPTFTTSKERTQRLNELRQKEMSLIPIKVKGMGLLLQKHKLALRLRRREEKKTKSTPGKRVTPLALALYYYIYIRNFPKATRKRNRLDSWQEKGHHQLKNESKATKRIPNARRREWVKGWTLTWEVSLWAFSERRWDPEIVDWSRMTCLVVLRIKNLSSGLPWGSGSGIGYGTVIGITVPPFTTRLPLRTYSMPLSPVVNRNWNKEWSTIATVWPSMEGVWHGGIGLVLPEPSGSLPEPCLLGGVTGTDNLVVARGTNSG